MPTLVVTHVVRDFDTWKEAFDSDPLGREASGVRRHRILRAADDPNDVTIELDFDTTREAESMLGRLQEMWTTAGPRLGLESPQVRVVDEVERKDY
jgi:hypothetical protein